MKQQIIMHLVKSITDYGHDLCVFQWKGNSRVHNEVWPLASLPPPTPFVSPLSPPGRLVEHGHMWSFLCLLLLFLAYSFACQCVIEIVDFKFLIEKYPTIVMDQLRPSFLSSNICFSHYKAHSHIRHFQKANIQTLLQPVKYKKLLNYVLLSCLTSIFVYLFCVCKGYNIIYFAGHI